MGFASHFSPSHGPLHFVTSHLHVNPIPIRLCVKNEVPEEEVALLKTQLILPKEEDKQNNQYSLCLLSLGPFPIVFSFDLSSAHKKELSATDAKLSQQTIGYFFEMMMIVIY